MLKIWLSICTLLSAIPTTLLWYFDKFGEGVNFPIVWLFTTMSLMILSIPVIIPLVGLEDLKQEKKEL